MNEEKRVEHKAPSIKATVRRSEKNPKTEAWLTMELSAERSAPNYDPDQDIVDVGDLAQELDMELRKVMSDSNERMLEETGEMLGTEESICAEHGDAYRRYEKGGDIWWAHQTASGNWCKKPSQTDA
jgi:hypothetical protein